MTDALTTFNLRSTVQTEQASPNQVLNSAGGYTFQISDIERLRRFLILGTDGGTYYASAKQLTKENALSIIEIFNGRNWREAVDTIVEISVSGRAPKQNPAIFALAIACSSGKSEVQNYAFSFLGDVCRIGTHIFLFAKYVSQLRGWGRSLRSNIADWYLDKDVKDLCYQIVKYRGREGYTHADLLRLSHPKAKNPTKKTAQNAVFKWTIKGEISDELTSDCSIIRAFDSIKNETDVDKVVSVIKENRLTWEMIPTEMLNSPKVWEVFLENGVPQTALLRQLPRLTNIGMLSPLSDTLKEVVNQLTDEKKLFAAKIHPYNLLVALKTYSSGKSFRGNSSWTPVQQIVDALDQAFYTSFDFLVPSNKRTFIALDISGSMGWSTIGDSNLSAREASAAMSLVTAKSEKNYHIVGFSGNLIDLSRNLIDLPISPAMRLNDVVKAVDDLPFGATDCALPMIEAQKHNINVDTFIIYTDSETFAGRSHPHQALESYRQKTGINAKLCVVGMTSTGFSIADPSDPGQLDVVGFDSAAPQLIADFSADTL